MAGHTQNPADGEYGSGAARGKSGIRSLERLTEGA